MKSKFPGNALGMTISASLVLSGVYALHWSPLSFIGLFAAMYTFFLSIEMTINNEQKP